MVLHVTVCTVGKRPLLCNQDAHRALVEAWTEASHWRVGEYVIMPEHLHLFCVPGVTSFPPVRRWAGYWKRLAGNIDPNLKSVFQQDCWDTQMRNRAHYEEKLSYVRRNPERKGLAREWQHWPYRGRVFDVCWL